MKNNHNLIQELQWRGMIHDATPGIDSLFEGESVAGYIGFDPTAPSLHIGNLAAIMLLKRLQLAGHKPIVLLGGFTGMIGDPAGKSTERKFLTEEVLQHNLASLKKQFSLFLDFENGKNAAEIVNNNDWMKEISLSEFLREVGKYITVNYMLAKDSVKKRLESGISFTEFSYQLFQAYDFLWLYENKNVRLQMGGSDQWGNITSGTELIRRKIGKDGFALTCPLITKSDGGKFGKTEDGNVWLDPSLTSPFQFYQFWLNVEDEQVGRLLRTFTLYDREEIEEMEGQNAKNPNYLKRKLAEDLTRRVHSEATLAKVVRASEMLFGKSTLADFEATDDKTLRDLLNGVPKKVVDTKDFSSAKIGEVAAQTFGISNSEVKRIIAGKGLIVNKTRVVSEATHLSDFELLKEQFLLLQHGKKFGLVSIED